MSLKTLIADLVKAGKKLPTGLERSIESLEAALGAIPAKSIGNFPFPPAQRAQFVDVVSDLLKSFPDNERFDTFKKVIAESGLRGKFPDGQAGTQHYTDFARSLAMDVEKRVRTPDASVPATAPTSRREVKPQSFAVVEPKPAPSNSGPVATPRAQTPPATPADTTVRVDLTGGRGTTNGGMVEDITPTPPKADADGRIEPSFDGLDNGEDAGALGRKLDDVDPDVIAALNKLRLDVLDKIHLKPGGVLQMDTEKFFDNLREMLQAPDLKILQDEPVARIKAFSPKEIYGELRAGRPVSRDELNDLEMFYRNHFDATISSVQREERMASLTAQSGASAGAFRNVPGVGRIVPAIEAGTRALSNISASSSGNAGRMTRDVMQEWETGSKPGFFARWGNGLAEGRRGTWAATGVLAAGVAGTAVGVPLWANARYFNLENPHPVNVWLAEAMWGSQDDKTDDHAEIIQNELSRKPEKAKEMLALFDIKHEDFLAIKTKPVQANDGTVSTGVSESDRKALLAMIKKLESPPSRPMIDTSAIGLIRYMSAQVNKGGAVNTPSEFRDLVAKLQTSEANVAQTAAGQKTQQKADIAAAAALAPNTLPADIFGGGGPDTRPSASAPTPQATGNCLRGSTFKAGVSGIAEPGEPLYRELEKAYQDVVRQSMQQEGSVVPSAKMAELKSAVTSILSRNGYAGNTAINTAEMLFRPANPDYCPAP